jgi:methylmalonyl-CoA mutase cobalamin-binding domain/chain
MTIDLANAVVELKKEDVLGEVQRRVEAGENALQVLEECRRGMTIVGEKFQSGDSFLAELMLSGEIFKQAMNIMKPYMAAAGPDKKIGSVIMVTLQGDIHDLGKDIVVTLLKARGFEVHNLGVDVPVNVFVEKVKEIQPHIVGFSSLLTTNINFMKEAVEKLIEEGLRDRLKVMIGGGITTEKTRDYVGADFQTLDANDGVNFCIETMGGA